MTNQNTTVKTSAAMRGLIGAAAGFAVMLLLILVLASMDDALPDSPGIIFLYLLAGPLYGFGLTFANWHLVMKQTKRAAIYATGGLAIGLILSHCRRSVKKSRAPRDFLC